MLRYALSMILVLLTGKVYAQVKAGARVPYPQFTNWLANVPSDTSLQGKLLVLDFWATWCAPCLASMPHFNDLVAANKEVGNLVFLSVTDEHESKVLPVLQKVSFAAAVVADTTHQVFEQFKIEGIPFCALVNERMEVQWAGHPAMLTNDIIRQFTRREVITAPSYPPDNMPAADAAIYDSLRVLYQTMRSDTTVKTYFNVGPLLSEGKGSTLTETSSFGKSEIVMGVGLQQLAARLLNVSGNQIVLPRGITKTFVAYCYKGAAINDEALLARIMEAVNLKATTRNVQQETILLEVTDTARLYSDLPDPDASDSRFSTEVTFISMLNDVPSVIVEGLQDRFQCPVILKQAGRFNKRINMTIKTADFSQLQQSLQTYGIKATRRRMPQKVYHFQYQNNPAAARL